ncbi:hypothetical protein ACFE04_021720 [Oxalis oulophora]
MSTTILKKIFPIFHESIPRDDDDDINVEYSFAIEYNGPPISKEIPRSLPVEFDHIPIAATLSSASASVSAALFTYKSVPVIEPIVKGSLVERKLSRQPNVSRMDSGSNIRFANEVECELDKLPDEIGSSLGCGNEKLGEIGIHRNNSGSAQSELESESESESTSASVSSEIFFGQEEDDCDNTLPGLVRRPSVVTFRDPEQSDVVNEESDMSEPANVVNVAPPRKAERKGKKGTCYRCLKKNQFIEKKEICIVCSAKYCANCVLRAMGSMPEGRKCVGCIGCRIHESKRGTLGKCSGMLKRLLTELEVQQIMRSEISCAANQLPPELIFVNGEPLSLDELLQLQHCPNPPNNLRPGSYWYDKVSGYWGKVGKKPCQIISPQLKVGGEMKRDSSNGKTDITINGREITQRELYLLQAAGVQCEGKPSFWLSADGSYQEEGQKNIKGCIWDKTRVKVVSAMLSLPFPSDSGTLLEEKANGNSPICISQKSLKRFLLTGYEKSGTSTIYKQAKLQYDVPFTEDERQSVKLIIQRSLYTYVAILLQGRERFEEESLIDMRKHRSVEEPGPSGENDKTIYFIGPKIKNFSNWLIQVFTSNNIEIMFPAATREYAPFIEDLMRDAAFRATLARISEFKMLPRVAAYFIERAVEISKENYEPSDMDILNAEGITTSNGLSSMEFSFPESRRESCIDAEDCLDDSSLRYQLIRVHPKSLNGNRKWLEMFVDVDIILFSVSLTDYDEFYVDSNGEIRNKIMESKKLFENIVTHPAFKEKTFLLVLTKFDLLDEKLKNVPLNKCEWFHDFNPVISNSNHTTTRSSSRNNNATLAQRAFHYIAVKFKRMFDTLSDCKLFVSAVSGLEPDSVDETLRYAKEIIKWYDEERSSVNNAELSSYEQSSTS